MLIKLSFVKRAVIINFKDLISFLDVHNCHQCDSVSIINQCLVFMFLCFWLDNRRTGRLEIEDSISPVWVRSNARWRRKSFYYYPTIQFFFIFLSLARFKLNKNGGIVLIYSQGFTLTFLFSCWVDETRNKPTGSIWTPFLLGIFFPLVLDKEFLRAGRRTRKMVFVKFMATLGGKAKQCRSTVISYFVSV